MVAIKSLLALSFFGLVAATVVEREEEVEERAGFLGLTLPTFSGNNMEYSLHSSKTNKHLGSCHIYLQNDKELAYPVDPAYKCSKKTRFCKANGPGAKQAFINNCNLIAIGAPALYLPHGYN